MGARGNMHKTNKGLISLSYKNFSKINMKNILLKKWQKGIHKWTIARGNKEGT